MVFDTLLPNTYPQSQEAPRKKKKPVNSGLWGACLASSLLCELGWMLSLSGLWDLNLGAANSKACSVSVRLPGLLYSECVVEGLRGAETQPEVPLSDPGRGLHPPQRNGEPFFSFLQDAVWHRGGPLRTKKVGGTLQSLGGTLHFPLTS